MLGTLADCYRAAGWRVIGVAPTGRAARQLREVAGIPAGTMHALLGELDRSRRFAAGTVLVLDEAGMAPTRLTARLFAHAERAGVKVLAVGDPGQLGSVEAGGWLAAVARQSPAPQLRQVMRQRDPKEREALEALRDGEPARYLSHKQEAIAVHPTASAALLALAKQWHTAEREHGIRSAVMIARDNGTRERLNRAARAQLKRDGALPAEGTAMGGREFAEGDRVIARRNDRQLDLDNGAIGTVISVSDRDGVRIETDSGQVRELDRSTLPRISSTRTRSPATALRAAPSPGPASSAARRSSPANGHAPRCRALASRHSYTSSPSAPNANANATSTAPPCQRASATKHCVRCIAR